MGDGPLIRRAIHWERPGGYADTPPRFSVVLVSDWRD
jgi:hypothetical protein